MKVMYRPAIDGFAFHNGFVLDDAELAQVRDIFHKAVAVALAALTPAMGPLDILLATVGVPPGTLELASGAVLASGDLDCLVDDQFHKSVGFCGGMAWTSCDYWTASWPIMRGTTSPPVASPSDPAASALRAYLFQRHLDTYAAGVAAETIKWLAILKLIPESQNGGAPALRKMTAAEWPKLKAVLDSGHPCPIALMRDTWDPGHDHQVLAYGYDGDPSGTLMIYIYDNVAPDVETSLVYDFTAPTFAGIERGFFVPQYTAKTPPIAIALTRALTVSPNAPYSLGERLSFGYQVTNLGCGDSVPLELGVHGNQAPAWVLDTPETPKFTVPRPIRPIATDPPPPAAPPPMHQLPELDFYALGAAPAATLPAGGSATAQVGVAIGAAFWDVTAMALVETIDGHPVYKTIPSGPSQVTAEVRVSVAKPPAPPSSTTSSTSSSSSTGTSSGHDGSPNPPPVHPPHIPIKRL